MKQMVCSKCADILSNDQLKQHNYHQEFLVDQDNLQKCINQMQEEFFKENQGIQYYDALIDVKYLIEQNIKHLEKRLTITNQYSAIKNKDYKRIFELYDYDKNLNKLSLIIRNTQFENQVSNELNESKKFEKQINQDLDTINKVKDIAIQYQKNNQEIQEKLIENQKRKRPQAQDIYQQVDVQQKFSTFFPDKKSKKKILMQSPKQSKKVQLNDETEENTFQEKEIIKKDFTPSKSLKKVNKELKEDLQIINQTQKNLANLKQSEIQILAKAIQIGNLEKASKQLQVSKYTIQELIPKYYHEKQIIKAIQQQLQKIGEHDIYWFFIFTENKQEDNHPIYSLFDQKIIGVEALALGKDHIELISKKYQISQSTVESYSKQAQNISLSGENDKLLEFMDSSMEQFLRDYNESENKNIQMKIDINGEIPKN